VRVVCFRFSGKYGHFLRAEANANGITYPYPPRTALLGLVGAVLGLAKDEPQVRLTDAKIAVGGVPPKRFWHKTKVRKDPPASLPRVIKAKMKVRDVKPEHPWLFPQEWLWNPNYRVWIGLQGDDHSGFVARVKERRWHFTQSLGLAFLFADLEFVAESEAERLPYGSHLVSTLTPHTGNNPDTATATAAKIEPPLGFVSLRMPAAATADRVFTHKAYWFEHAGRPFPVCTADAWRCDTEKVVFL
jgi:CRISPR-associated protein Cas5h